MWLWRFMSPGKMKPPCVSTSIAPAGTGAFAGRIAETVPFFTRSDPWVTVP